MGRRRHGASRGTRAGPAARHALDRDLALAAGGSDVGGAVLDGTDLLWLRQALMGLQRAGLGWLVDRHRFVWAG